MNTLPVETIIVDKGLERPYRDGSEPISPRSALSSPEKVPPFVALSPLEDKVYRRVVELRAWQIWQSEGCPENRAAEHWARAEAEVRAGRAARSLIRGTQPTGVAVPKRAITAPVTAQ